MSDSDDIISTTARVMAQNAVLAALVRLHPEPQALRDMIEQFAEANRSQLLPTAWTDEQIQKHDQSLGVLTNTLPPPSAK